MIQYYSTNAQKVSETLGDNKSTWFSLAFQKGIGSHCRSHTHTVYMEISSDVATCNTYALTNPISRYRLVTWNGFASCHFDNATNAFSGCILVVGRIFRQEFDNEFACIGCTRLAQETNAVSKGTTTVNANGKFVRVVGHWVEKEVAG